MKPFLRLGLLAITVLVGAWLGRLLSLDPGVVLIYFHGYRVQFSVLTAMGLVVATTGLLWLALHLARRPWAALRSLHERRRQARLSQGLLALVAGRWSQAQQLLGSVTGDDAMLAASRCLAADAARQTGDHTASRALLQVAGAHHAEAKQAALLASARDALTSGDAEHCLQQLDRMPANAPAAAKLLRADALEALGHTQELLKLLPQLKSTLAPELWQARCERATLKRLRSAATAEELRAAWRGVAKEQRTAAPLLAAYLEASFALGDPGRALRLTLKTVLKAPAAELLETLARTPKSHVAQVLKALEPLGQSADADPRLLYTLGRLCITAGLWGQAKHYLTVSLKTDPRLPTQRYLGEVLEHDGLNAEAMTCYKEALKTENTLPVIRQS